MLLRQNGGRSCWQVTVKWVNSKARTTFSEEETENLISLWSEEEVLFNSRHKDYFKKDVRQNAINRILLRLDKQGKPIKS